jgi:hypothetical protein
MEYLKHKINELGMNSKIRNIRDQYRVIKEFMRGCQPRSNILKDKKKAICMQINTTF